MEKVVRAAKTASLAIAIAIGARFGVSGRVSLSGDL